MFQNVDQLEKPLDKEEFQKIGSMAAFRVLETLFQKFIKPRVSLNDEDGIMARKYFLEYTKLEVQKFRDTLIQHMEFVKNSIDERALYKREYDTRVNERQMHTIEGKVDTSITLDASLVDTESTVKSGQHGQSLKEKINEAKVKQDIDVIEIINIELEYKVAKLLKENETLKKHYKELYDSIKTTRAKTIEHTTSLIAQNVEFKAQLQEKEFGIAALKNELRKLTGNSVNTKFAKPSILGKQILHPLKNQSVVRHPTGFKSA
ncbi:hypothetical protein Tco_0701616 [Tanacetum coccineum]